MPSHANKINTPTYDLAEIQVTVRKLKSSAFTGSSLQGMAEISMSVQDAIDCIDNLDEACFYKSMPSMKDPNHFQDVYHGMYWGKEIYIKFTGYPLGPVVISFKER